MKILVTGGAGFIGSQIADAYVTLGHEVGILDNLSTGKKSNVNAEARFHQVDICDTKAVASLLDREKFDIVNHHAAQIDVRRSVSDPVYDASINILGVLNLAESAVRSGVSKFIFASSGGAMYGEQEYFPADENHPTNPISPYGITKLTTEKYLYYYKAVHGMNYVNLRYANIYGPRQNPEGEAGVVSIFATRMLKNDQAYVNGDGTQTRDYVFVGDVVRANVLALNVSGSDAFNVGTGIETNVNQIFDIIKKHTGAAIERRHREGKKGEQARSVLDGSKIGRVLGWKPTVTLDEGLSKTVEFFRVHA